MLGSVPLIEYCSLRQCGRVVRRRDLHRSPSQNPLYQLLRVEGVYQPDRLAHRRQLHSGSCRTSLCHWNYRQLHAYGRGDPQSIQEHSQDYSRSMVWIILNVSLSPLHDLLPAMY